MRTSRIIHGAIAVAIAASAVLLASPAQADLSPAPGYGDDGMLELDVLDEVGAMTVDDEGRTVLFGAVGPDLAFARLLADGTVDTSFADDGIARVAYLPAPEPEIQPFARGAAQSQPGWRADVGVADVRVLADGSIVGAGHLLLHWTMPGGDNEFTDWSVGVAKVSASGSTLLAPTVPQMSGLGGVAAAFVGADGSTVFQSNGGCNGCDQLSFRGPDGTTGALFGGDDQTDPLADMFKAALGADCMVLGMYGIPAVGVAEVTADEVVVAVSRYITSQGAACAVGENLAVSTLVVRMTPVEAETAWVRAVPNALLVGRPAVVGDDVVVPLAIHDGPTTPSNELPSRTAEVVERLAVSDGEPVASFGSNGRVTLREHAPWLTSDLRNQGAVLTDGRFLAIAETEAQPEFGGQPAVAGASRYTLVGTDGSVVHEFTRTAALGTNSDGNTEMLVPRGAAATPDGYSFLLELVESPPYDPEVGYRTFATGELYRFDEPPGVPDIEPLSPGRLLDTRPAPDGSTVDGQFVGSGLVGPDDFVRVKVAGRGGVPDDASAAVLNVTAVFPQGPGFLTVYPCTATVPTASTVNYSEGSVVANGVTAKLDDDGYVCVYSLVGAHVLIDVNGFLPGASAVVPISPQRFLETRSGADFTTFDGQSQGVGIVGPDDFVRVKIADRGEVPAGASAAILNVTAVFPEGPGFLTVYPCTATVPTASSVNYGPGTVVANGVTAKLDDDGYVCVYSLVRADVLIDVGGYLPDATDVTPLTPARYLETRSGADFTTFDGESQGVGAAGPDGFVRVKIADRGDVPAGASAAVLNVTAVFPAGPGFLTVYPCTDTVPTASNVNYFGGDVVANNVTAKLDDDGYVCVYSLATADVLIDVGGYVS